MLNFKLLENIGFAKELDELYHAKLEIKEHLMHTYEV